MPSLCISSFLQDSRSITILRQCNRFIYQITRTPPQLKTNIPIIRKLSWLKIKLCRVQRDVFFCNNVCPLNVLFKFKCIVAWRVMKNFMYIYFQVPTYIYLYIYFKKMQTCKRTIVVGSIHTRRNELFSISSCQEKPGVISWPKQCFQN